MINEIGNWASKETQQEGVEKIARLIPIEAEIVRDLEFNAGENWEETTTCIATFDSGNSFEIVVMHLDGHIFTLIEEWEHWLKIRPHFIDKEIE